MDVSATLPIIVERAMYWPGANWDERTPAGIAITRQLGLDEGDTAARAGSDLHLTANPRPVRLGTHAVLVENGTSFVTRPHRPGELAVTASSGEFMGAASRDGARSASSSSVERRPLAVEHAIIARRR